MNMIHPVPLIRLGTLRWARCSLRRVPPTGAREVKQMSLLLAGTNVGFQ